MPATDVPSCGAQCAYFMARTPGTPGALDPQVRLEVGRQALLSLRSTLAGAGLTRGDAATLPHIEQFCSTQHATAARLPGVCH
eukprot:COSAG04_NODE_1614_length_6164_cov_66.962737_7_plen_83_part_00